MPSDFVSRLAKSIRATAKLNYHSHRKRNDSGYESTEDTDSDFEQIIANYQQTQVYHVYPVSSVKRPTSIALRSTTIDNLMSESHIPSPRSSKTSRQHVHRSASLLTQKSHLQSSINNNRMPTPSTRNCSTILDSNFGTLTDLPTTPRLNNQDGNTYSSTRFRNENTSKFVIGTLWNTFALVNNLFLQRSGSRRNATYNESTVHTDQLAHLEELHSSTVHDQPNEIPTNHLESVVNEILLEPNTNKTDHLRSIVSNMFISMRNHYCSCYGNHHIPSCAYYDHSLPYVRYFHNETTQFEETFRNVKQSNKFEHQNVAIQSQMKKPPRFFTHIIPTTNVATQSSPILTLTQLHNHRNNPFDDKNNISIQMNSKEVDNIDVSTQTLENNFDDKPIENYDHINNCQSKLNKYNDNLYVNVSTQFSPIVIKDSPTYFNYPLINNTKVNYIHASSQISPIKFEDISTQYCLEDIKIKHEKILNLNRIRDNHISNQRNYLINELKQALPSSTLNEETINDKESEKKSLPAHTVRSLVSMFETSSSLMKPNLVLQRKTSTKLTVGHLKEISPVDSMCLNIAVEETNRSDTQHDMIQQCVNEIAPDIIDNDILTATTTTIVYDNNRQKSRRFSLYKNGGGHGKNLLFQSNTFVPENDDPGIFVIKQKKDSSLSLSLCVFSMNSLAKPQTSSIFNDDPLMSLNREKESRCIPIVGQRIGDDNQPHLETKRRHSSLILDTKVPSSPSSLSLLDDEQNKHRQFLSHSELLSVQQLNSRSSSTKQTTTTSNVLYLNDDMNDKYIETITTNSFDTNFSIFPRHHNLDLTTHYTCLITILLYLHDIYDEYSNQILYSEIEQIEIQILNQILPSSAMVNSSVFKTINPDGSKRYRTGFVVDINSSNTINNETPKIHSKQIQWKRVKLMIRRFRKKYQHYKQLIKNDEKNLSNRLNIENHLKYFDPLSQYRMKKYAKHYAEKL